MKKYLIIGGGPAGVSCVEGIRNADAEGEITLISDESLSNYGRPLISYYLEHKTDLARMSWRGEDFYVKNSVRALHGLTAERIEPKERRVVLSDGTALDYDALCICTGSVPFCPPFEGLEMVQKRCSFMKLSDALWLEENVDKSSRVLIVGAGFIGLKCAEGLRDRAGSVTVCDLAPHVMSASLDADSAAILERHLERNGIELRLGDTVERFDGNAAHMRGGEIIPFDVLVLAVGVRPDAALVRAAGGEVNRGVLVGPGMETSLPQVWAAGDCTESVGLLSGESEVLANLPNAALQGRVAGANMAGGAARFDKGIRVNSVGLFGLHSMSAGARDDCIFSELTETTCKKLYAKDGVLTGFILVGDVARAGIYTALIRERRPLDGLDLDALIENPSLLPLGSGYRARTLGGAV